MPPSPRVHTLYAACVLVQDGDLPANFHIADSKTIRRLADTLVARGALSAPVSVKVPAAKQSMGVMRERDVDAYTLPGQVCDWCTCCGLHPAGLLR